MEHPREGQFSGCLIGQCLADALGFVVEGLPPRVCRQYVEGELKGASAGKRCRKPYPFGQYSDDSQLARELVASYVARKRFDPRDYAGRIAAIFKEERVVGRGRATEQAARRLIEGVSWEEAGTAPPSAGNGSAMRAAPVGLFFYDDPDRLIRAARDQGRITHRDGRCSAGAVAIAGAVALVLRHGPMERAVFLQQLGEWVGTVDDSVATAVRQLIEWSTLPAEQAVSFISRAGIEPGYSDGWEGISPFVTPSVLWSLYSFLRTPDDYWATVCTAIAVGGDVDTTAAMAGAISGAYLGLEAIPRSLARLLTDRGTWGFPELVELARECYEVKLAKGKT